MTTEEKAKAYDEALDRARRIKNGEDNWRYSDLSEIIPALEEVLPQLHEGEDERIRKELVEALKTSKTVGELKFTLPEPTREKCIAYLEKQKEQKPSEWSEDFDKEVENIHKRYPEVSFAKLTRIAYHFSKWANRCKDIKWSEEDSDILVRIINQVGGYTYFAGMDSEYVVNWLKSLRPSWKPSEEQEEPKYYQHFDPDC